MNGRRIEGVVGSCCACGSAGCALRYFYTCGTPACGPQRPVPGIPECTTQHQGEPCSVAGEMCNDPTATNSCVGPLLCTMHDPTANGRNCPISRRRFKRDIQYLTVSDARAVRDALLHIRLTSYELGVTLRRAIRNMQVAAPAAAKRYPGAPLIEPGAVTVEWDDAPGFTGSPAGMQLADSLATNMFQDLRRKGRKRARKRGMQKALIDAGYDEHCVIDMTPRLVAPIHGRRTG